MNVKFKVKYQTSEGKTNTKTREVHLTESQGIRDAWMLIGRLATLEEDKLVGIDLAEGEDEMS